MGIRDHDIARCLVDEESSIDILYQDAFEKLGLRIEESKPYEGTNLYGSMKQAPDHGDTSTWA